jgi:hypothetical protein
MLYNYDGLNDFLRHTLCLEDIWNCLFCRCKGNYIREDW